MRAAAITGRNKLHEFKRAIFRNPVGGRAAFLFLRRHRVKETTLRMQREKARGSDLSHPGRFRQLAGPGIELRVVDPVGTLTSGPEIDVQGFGLQRAAKDEDR